jgi:hypothetical protein
MKLEMDEVYSLVFEDFKNELFNENGRAGRDEILTKLKGPCKRYLVPTEIRLMV